ncbi:MAG: DUF4295 domain-containing protein [Candidatus Cyclonatronum sp.]|uniref:DUF4295 domain-containing protein n=1 Tax=Cyclonatronum sp. TaxID=3024185 RepID=UPI0025C1BCEE|nr:DUF4295 domain-containing protein [Cyclonatronum sp.]MCC5933495.1 DUF4295 domain-containing protein [Balneolales bacterium]MCH8485215.1 DUF4295 domain-containing protein [Cyclonatronum sp.]
MAKKQSFGEKVLAAKMSQRKMAKVIIGQKTAQGSPKFKEAIVEADKISDFISANRS